MEEEHNSTGYTGSTEQVTPSEEGYVIPDVVVVDEKPEDPPAAPYLLPVSPLPKPEIKPVDDNVLKRRDRNNRVLRSKATQTRIGSLWQIGTISSSTWNATPPSYFPTAPFTSWRDGNSLKGHYFQVYHEQTNSDFYIVQNANGTQTYVEKTFDEKFHYYNKNTEQWEPFTPAGYETSAQKIQRMKNIA
ncbi:MAG: hypothetical protein JNK66_01985, partial [Chitinophagales bacterium]|nr:hypothetical protein [Chitinophagales bacterium]